MARPPSNLAFVHHSRLCLRRFVLLLVVMILPPLALADDAVSHQAEAYRSTTEARFSRILHDIDPAVQVFVKTTAKVADLSLPGTPFSLKNAAVPSGDGEAHFATIDVTILTSLAKLPAGVEAYLQALLEDQADEVNLTVSRLPQALIPPAVKAADAALTKAEVKPWEAPLAQLLGQTNIVAEKAAKWPDRVPAWLSASNIVTFGLGSALLLALGTLLTGFLWLRSQRKILAALNQGFRQMAVAYENGGGASSPLRITPANQNTLELDPVRQSAPSPSGISPSLAAMSDESLLALLSDCYWTNQDNYGAYLWRHLPLEKKRVLLHTLPLLEAYATYINQLPEQDQGFEQDPCYLNPLPLWHLDTAAVTELVKGHPALIHRLSPMRVASLQLRPAERLSLAVASQGLKLAEALDFDQTTSTERALPRALQIQIRSEADEREVLAVDEPPLALIEQVPSLGWLLRLPEAEIAAILQPFTARDLASAWTAPSEVLAKLGPLVGDKKLEMVQFQLSKAKPSRSSPVFLALHRASVEALRLSAEAASSVGSKPNAA